MEEAEESEKRGCAYAYATRDTCQLCASTLSHLRRCRLNRPIHPDPHLIPHLIQADPDFAERIVEREGVVIDYADRQAVRQEVLQRAVKLEDF